MIRSPSPQMIWVGTLTRCSQRSSRGLKKRGCQPKRALAMRLRMARSWYLSAPARSAASRALLRVGVGEAGVLLRVDHEDIGLGHALDVNAGGRDQGQAAQPMGRAHRHLKRDPAAERLSDHVKVGETERLDGVEIAISDVGNVIDPRRRLRRAEAGMIGHDHVEALGQRIENGGPFGEPVGAVQVEQRRALAGAHEAELAAVDVDRVPDKCHRPPAVPVRQSGKRRGGRQPAQTFSRAVPCPSPVEPARASVRAENC